MRRPALLVALAALMVTGCKTLPEKIESLTLVGEYNEARQLLEEEGVGTHVGFEVSPDQEDGAEALKARNLFKEKVEGLHGERARSYLVSGASRTAARLAAEALELCPWSSEIRELRAKADSQCARLDGLLAKEKALAAEAVEPSRAFVLEAKPALAIATDDLAFRTAVRRRSEVVARHEADLFLAAVKAGQVAAAKAHLSRFAELDVPERELTNVRAAALFLLDLPTATKAKEANAAITALESIDDAVLAIGQEKVARGFRDALAALSLEWAGREMEGFVVRFAASDGAFVSSLERMLGRRSRFREAISPHIARAHVLRAEKLSRMGSAAAAALAHLGRADELSPSPGNAAIREVALATLGKLPPRQYTVTVASGAGTSPSLVPQLFLFSTIALRLASHEDVEWGYTSPDDKAASLVVRLDSAERRVPSSSDLSPVSSRHFSHMQTVPNPAKAALKAQLSGAEFQVNMAESNYRSAVNSFNIYPTQYSLNAANYAENAYRMAINNFNALVNVYNITPDTIEQPVYLPYFYMEGVMRCGVTVSGSVVAGGVSRDFRSHHMDVHNVRIGTKTNDTNPGARFDREYPYPSVGDRMMRHLIAFGEDVVRQVAGVPLLPTDDFLDDLDKEERACAAYVMHPVRDLAPSRLDVPSWAASSLPAQRFRPGRREPPRVTLERFDLAPALAGGLQDKLPVLRELTCKIECETPLQSSSGSGALISADGLVLTAAHVIQGSRSKVVLAHGPHAGTYETELVFVDGRSDVAVLRAKGLRPARWFPVRLEGAIAQGSEVVALGYPYVANSEGSQAESVQTVTTGIVSSVSEEGELVADLTVASGNSGGPIVDPASGEIVGVVSAVISPGIDKSKGYASSGFWCRGFAANRLGKSLGLVPGPSGKSK